MKYPKIKKKRRWPRTCFNCKHYCEGCDRHHWAICDRFEFCSFCKSK